MKYINFDVLGIVTFGDHVRHDTMAQIIGHKVISAGQVAGTDELRCCGESVSLNAKSDPKDTQLLRSYGR